MSRLSERDKGDRGYVARVDVWNFPVTRRRVDSALFDDILGLGNKVGWPAPGPEDTELRCLMEQEAGHGETAVHARVQG
jgi:hypothetical protein